MKKLLCGLLSICAISSYAFSIDDLINIEGGGKNRANFYTVIVNNSTKFDVSIWAKNSLYWDNWGWCDGANDSNTSLMILPGQTRVYCGGDTLNLIKAPSDSPHLQHEWWFANHGQNDWWQNYSEQWRLYNYAQYPNDTRQPIEETVKISELSVPQNDWNNAIDFSVSMSSDIDNPPNLSNDIIAVYTINDDQTMTLQQYSVPFKTVSDYNILKNNPFIYAADINNTESAAPTNIRF